LVVSRVEPIGKRSKRRKGLWIAIATLGAAVALVALLFSWLAAGFGCSEASDCAIGRGQYAEYRGRFFDGQGRPLGRMNLQFRSELFEGADLIGDSRRTFGVATDDLARFCVRTFASYDAPSIDPPLTGDPANPRPVLPAALGPVDPRFQDLARLDSTGIHRPPTPGGGPYGVMEPPGPPGGIIRPDGTFQTHFQPTIHLVYGWEATALWDPALDKAAGCHDLGEELHWYDFHDNFTSWQFILLMLAPLLTGLLYLSVLVAWFHSRRRPVETAWLIRRSQQTAAMSVITVGLTALLWFVTI
jgi:hypothetical protein